MRHFLRANELIEFLAGQIAKLEGGFAQAGVIDVRSVSDSWRPCRNQLWAPGEISRNIPPSNSLAGDRKGQAGLESWRAFPSTGVTE